MTNLYAWSLNGVNPVRGNAETGVIQQIDWRCDATDANGANPVFVTGTAIFTSPPVKTSAQAQLSDLIGYVQGVVGAQAQADCDALISAAAAASNTPEPLTGPWA